MREKTIGILTHYQVHNHGALLQMYGLYHSLQKLGLAPCVLTYEKNFGFLSTELKNKYALSLKSIPFYLRYLREQGVSKTWFNFRKKRLLSRFNTRNFVFVPLKNAALDYVVVGSDEVFSLEVGLNRMMYGHGVTCKKIFSYAASFGQTNMADIEKKNCREIMTGGLRKFAHICVRDQSSADTIEALLGQRPEIHFDPVLLYGFAAELQNSSYAGPKGRYLLLYAYDNHLNSPEEIEAVRSYARAHKLKIVSPGFYHAWADINLNVNPLELLQVFKQANCVVTDTFHGSVLSILTNRPFAAFVRAMNTNKMSYLLHSLCAQQAHTQRVQDVPRILEQRWDWAAINQNIQGMREKALSYLKGVLYG